MLSKVVTRSDGVTATTGIIVSPSLCPAASISFKNAVWAGLGLLNAATRFAFGTSSVRNSSDLADKSGLIIDTPVMLPPGLASDLTKPEPIGSPVDAITIGMDEVACCAAKTAGVANL